MTTTRTSTTKATAMTATCLKLTVSMPRASGMWVEGCNVHIASSAGAKSEFRKALHVHAIRRFRQMQQGALAGL